MQQWMDVQLVSHSGRNNTNVLRHMDIQRRMVCSSLLMFQTHVRMGFMQASSRFAPASKCLYLVAARVSAVNGTPTLLAYDSKACTAPALHPEYQATSGMFVTKA